jgi:hypothetical protein
MKRLMKRKMKKLLSVEGQYLKKLKSQKKNIENLYCRKMSDKFIILS